MLRSCACGRPTANIDGQCSPCTERDQLLLDDELEADDREPDYEAIAESRAMARRWVGDRV